MSRPPHRGNLVRFVAVVASLLLPAACNDGTSPEAGPSSFSRLQTEVFDVSCAGCHAEGSGVGQSSGLVLAADVSYEELVGVEPMRDDAREDGLLLVAPGDPDGSLLLHKVRVDQDDAEPTYGAPMPPGGPALSVGEVEFIRRWIAEGAPREGAPVEPALLDDTTPQVPDDGPDLRGEGVIQLAEVVSGLGILTALAAPPDDPRLFVVEQEGRIHVVENGALLDDPFLDITHETVAVGEQGLLGLAFHPGYATNGRLFVNYTDVAGDTRIVEYRVSSADPNRADPSSAAELLSVEQPGMAHNGGHLEFGPDGMLFVSTGDGGGKYDPHENAQNVSTLLGGILRLDVSAPGQVAIPPDNPFAGEPDEGAGELWAWGLRNPWRFSFDWETDLLYIADVGQDFWEEVNVAPASGGGFNYGYPVVEGPECVTGLGCDRSDFVEPAVFYPHQDLGQCSVTGGAVYRGDLIPEAVGHYFYSDLCGRFLRSFRYEGGAAVEERDWGIRVPSSVSSMGRDAAGDLYLLTVGGTVYRMDPGEGA